MATQERVTGTPTTPLKVATAFMSALDANDAEAVRRCFSPGATWWVDTGWDRAAGDLHRDPGPDRPYPLHGLMDAAAKAEMLTSLPERFPGGCRQHVRRSFAGGAVAILEVEGDGLYRGVRPYRNCYCFIIEVRDGLVFGVREYLDTAHSASVFDGRNLERRSEAPEPTVDVLDGRSDLSSAEHVSAAFLAALNNADPAALFAACTPEATWWHDGGRERTAGPGGPVEEEAALVLVGKVPVSVRGLRISRFRQTYPNGFKLRAHRITADDAYAGSGLIAVEATGHGERAGGLYQNRYAFVLRVESGLIAEIREYCDTRHAFDIYGIDRL